MDFGLVILQFQKMSGNFPDTSAADEFVEVQRDHNASMVTAELGQEGSFYHVSSQGMIADGVVKAGLLWSLIGAPGP